MQSIQIFEDMQTIRANTRKKINVTDDIIKLKKRLIASGVSPALVDSQVDLFYQKCQGNTLGSSNI
jgi:hypothetical protein